MSSSVSTMPRQGVNARQAETVERLLAAAADDLRAHGPDRVSVRSVARLAGVSSGTAYTYFASKGHLLAELFLRHLHDGPPVDQEIADPVARVQAVTDAIIGRLVDFPELAVAVTPALLGVADPDVARLRVQIGNEIIARFAAALDTADPALLQSLTYSLLGGLLGPGIGLVGYAELAEQLRAVVATILRGNV